MFGRRRTLALALLLLGSSSAVATTWIAPQQHLTPDQWVDYDISGADAIGVGYITGVRDTVVDVGPDGSGIPARSITVHFSDWLRGDPGTQSLLVGVSPLDPQPVKGEDLFESVGPEHPKLFLLRRVENGWSLCDGPDPDGVGVRAIPSQLTAFKRTMSARISKLSVDSVLTRAAIVVIGRCVGGGRCNEQSPIRCGRIVVERVLGKNTVGDTISVFAPLLGDIPDERAIYLLHSTSAGYFEPVGFQAGIQRIDSGRTARWRMSVDEIDRRLSGLRATQGRAGAPR